ncbi:MAG TPA: FCD domain-containing protein [Marmoricola sp.]|jgi:DNA-binding FadR family transcriptional regulator|nr:FCD domain-containing protein [Marmoricola sp.]
MQDVRRYPLASQAADVLLDRIRAGRWSLGEKLPGETTLATELGVGRSTVREAVRELAGKGVLSSRQGAGVFVTALDVAEDWNDVLARVSVVAVLEARIALESESAALAARRRTAADLRVLRRTLAARAPARRSTEAHVDADLAFHRAVVAAAHNELLSELFDGFVPRVRPAMVGLLTERSLPAGPDHAAHEDLLAAIVAGDADRAATVSRTHLDDLVEWLS